jgi:multiple sugar transport system ATP-binding protein
VQVKLVDVTKAYGDVEAVKSLSAEIGEGAFVTVVGPSGSGKTTLLRLIAGLVQPTSGNVLFDGRVANSIEPAQRNVAMVFQRYALYPLTAYENLALPLRAQALSRNEIVNKIDQIANLLGIQSLLHRRIANLSGGEQQRVALGRALVRDPSLFLLDEPLSNLDPSLRGKLIVELADLHNRLRITTVMVTHDPSEATALGQSIMVVKDGALIQYASPDEIFKLPRNRFVAEFTNEYRLSFVRGRVKLLNGQLAFLSNGCTWNFPEPSAGRSLELVGKEVELGLRPDNLILDASGDVRGTVLQVQRGASEYRSVLDTNVGRVIARTPVSSYVSEGASLRFRVIPDHGLLFDPDTKESLVYEPVK